MKYNRALSINVVYLAEIKIQHKSFVWNYLDNKRKCNKGLYNLVWSKDKIPAIRTRGRRRTFRVLPKSLEFRTLSQESGDSGFKLLFTQRGFEPNLTTRP